MQQLNHNNEFEGEPQLEQKDIINYVNSFHIFHPNDNKTFHSKLFLPFSAHLIGFYQFAKTKTLSALMAAV
jgi:hypothetical protein